ncbi:MAG: 4-(cytidine 5'-diphospho)-2-C-methyl-D-erythritol kinase [Tepidisphaeraceae bacterium]
MRIPAPAKINLHLRVGPLGNDGFHPLLSWMVAVGLFDTLTLVRRPAARVQSVHNATGPAGSATPAPVATTIVAAGAAPIFALSSDHPTLETDHRNLVVRAATALADQASRVGEGSTGGGLTSVSALLHKRIPAGAGLGGGSSDAAATLIGLNRLWKLDWPAARLAGLAAQLGSDVPFFLGGSSSICTGRGEIVRPTPPPIPMGGPEPWAVLVLPKIEVSTPAVYRRFDEMKLGSEQVLRDEPDWLAWSKLSAAELMSRLVNDLEPPAFSLRPELGELRQALERQLGRVVRMSGSGSSLFTLCDSMDEARTLAGEAMGKLNVGTMAVPLAPKMGFETMTKLD